MYRRCCEFKLMLFRYCQQGSVIGQCPIGHYCPAGTGFDWQQCPVGTYNNETGLTSSAECSPCPGGRYCDSLGMSTSSGACLAGYFCEYGVDRADPGGNGTCVGPGM